MDIIKTKKLIDKCKKIEQYLIYIPEISSCEYIKICVWKISEFRYWAQSNLTLHFIEMDMYEYPCGSGDTPQEAFQAFIMDLMEYHKKCNCNTSEVLFEEFP